MSLWSEPYKVFSEFHITVPVKYPVTSIWKRVGLSGATGRYDITVSGCVINPLLGNDYVVVVHYSGEYFEGKEEPYYSVFARKDKILRMMQR